MSTYAVGGAAIAALVLAACGTDDDESTDADTSGEGSDVSTVVVENTDLGDILADGHDRTIYLFLEDQGTTSACNDACAVEWPPLTVDGAPTAGSGADQSLIGTTMRSDGETQVTYNGHPVYRFAGDQSPGDTAGQGLVAFGAAWYVLSPAGDQVSRGATGSDSSGSSGSSSSGSSGSGSGE